MMIPEAYVPEIETEDRPQTNNPSPLAWLFCLSRKQQIFGAIAVVSVGWIAFGGKGEMINTVQNGFTPKINKALIEKSANPQETTYYTISAEMTSGFLGSRSAYFLGQVANFRNDKEHPCSALTVPECLLTFVRSRQAQIVTWQGAKNLDSVTRENKIAIAALEIQALDLLITKVEESSTPEQKIYAETIRPYEVAEQPVELFVTFLGQQLQQRENDYQTRRKLIERQVINPDVAQCREIGGDCL